MVLFICLGVAAIRKRDIARHRPWMMRAFKLLARLKGLRGGRFDIFGRSAERRLERRMIDDYENLLDELAGALTDDNHRLIAEIAALPMKARGFGHVKLANWEKAQAEQQRLMRELGTMASDKPRVAA